MKRLTGYVLLLTIVLWAVCPAALADAGPAEPAMIDVTVPGSGNVTINPYRFPIEMDGTTVTDQIINKEQILVNRSNVPVIMCVSVTAATSEGSTLTITDRPIEAGEQGKLAYLYVEFQALPDADSVPTWSNAYTGASNQLLVSSVGPVSGDVLRLGAGDEVPARAAYRLFGSLSDQPLDSWGPGDGLTVTVSFTFRPEGEVLAAAEPQETPDEPEVEPELAPEMEQDSEAEDGENWLTPETRTEPEQEPEQDFREDDGGEWLTVDPEPEEEPDTDTGEEWPEPETKTEPDPEPEQDSGAEDEEGWLIPAPPTEPDPDPEPEQSSAADSEEGWLTLEPGTGPEPQTEQPPAPETEENWLTPGTEPAV